MVFLKSKPTIDVPFGTITPPWTELNLRRTLFELFISNIEELPNSKLSAEAFPSISNNCATAVLPGSCDILEDEGIFTPPKVFAEEEYEAYS